MKFILIFLLPLLITTTGFSQQISYEDFKGVLPYLIKEDFKSAFEKTNQLLNNSKNDSSDLHGIVAYMNIYSAAGMVTVGQMTHAEFLINANKYIGQRLVMAAHPCIDSSTVAYNSLKFVTKDGKLEGETVTANNKKTAILCFEYYRYAQLVNPIEFIGKNVRCSGILEKVEVNPNNSRVWISKLYFRDAFVREMKEK